MIHLGSVRLLIWIFTGKNEVVPPPRDEDGGGVAEMGGYPVISG